VRFVVFELSGRRYALDVRQVSEISPLPAITPIAHAPEGVAGIAELRGAPIPVVDLAQIMLDRPAARRLSTRLIVVHYAGQDGTRRRLALIAERVTQIVERHPDDFVETGISHDGAPYLGPVAREPEGFLQWVEVDALLPRHLRDILFTSSGEKAWSSPTSNIS
jgi:chemotaxis-related protein WspB